MNDKSTILVDETISLLKTRVSKNWMKTIWISFES